MAHRRIAALLALVFLTPVLAEEHPPIPVRFKLAEAGKVTLVIETADGRRVRNLIAETDFPAGEHTVWWDGADESGEVRADPDGIHRPHGQLVEPGTYHARGLVHGGIDLIYEFSVYTPGSPPWKTADGSGRWLADHSPPNDVLHLPARGGTPARMLITSFVAEGGDGLVFTDLDGRKRRGLRWVGGAWTGALHAARDAGPLADPEVLAYAISSWPVGDNHNQEAAELRVTALLEDGDRGVLAHRFSRGGLAGPGDGVHSNDSDKRYVAGFAVRDGLMVMSLDRHGLLGFADAAGRKAPRFAKLDAARGVAFDGAGRLLVIAGGKLLRFDLDAGGIIDSMPAEAGATAGGEGGSLSADFTLPRPEILISDGLEDPRQITLDGEGNLYLSDWGAAHQVKVFDPAGRPLRVIGRPGRPAAGAYDQEKMHHPHGLAISERGELWVAETDYAPKRVSVWSTDGTFLRAFYGPSQYGGGGSIDPLDRERFYYTDEKFESGMEFRLDWEERTSTLTHIYWRPGEGDLRMPPVGPQHAIHRGGRHYMTNLFNANPVSSPEVLGIWEMRGGLAKPLAAVGNAYQWAPLRDPALRGAIPGNVDFSKPDDKGHWDRHPLMFAWADRNLDSRVQADELNFSSEGGQRPGELYLTEDFQLTTSFGGHLTPTFTDAGVPMYDVSGLTFPTPVGEVSWTSGARPLIGAPDGWQIAVGGPLRGFRKGQARWTYPNAWPGLHPGHDAPPQQYSGQLIATTKPIGRPFRPEGADFELWAYNGDRGNIYLMTMDGLFVSQLFADSQVGGSVSWDSKPARRGERLTGVSKHGEDFWPTINPTAEGPVYLVAGKEHSSIVRIDGLGAIKRIDAGKVEVTPELLAEVGEHVVRRDAARQQGADAGTVRARVRDRPPEVDGDLAEWADADWVAIDESASAAVAIAGDRLFAAWRSLDGDLLANSAESLPMLFKTGGALDLMLATDGGAPAGRERPVAGDLRLLVTRAEGEVRAALYRPVHADRAPVPFSSPWRTVTFDRVDDLSRDVELGSGERVEIIDEDGRERAVRWHEFEISVPLSTLGFAPKAGESYAIDLGLLRGRDGETTRRAYWRNKATGLMNDVPGEAMLHPRLWGKLEVVE